MVLWDVPLYSLVDRYQHSVQTCCLHHQGKSRWRGILQNNDKKFTLEQAMRLPRGEKMYSSTFSWTLVLDGEGGQCQALVTWHLGKTRYPLYRRLGRPQGQSGWVRKILPPPGFDPWTVQPIASHFTDYTILAHPKYWQPPTKLHSATSHIPEGCSLNQMKY